ncbi:MAG: response regulator [Nitrospirae bacterium]|nr:response regulator [Nitrospirota bacterium]
MKDIIEWLIGIEERAARLYMDAANCLHADNELADLLKHLAEEEQEHVKLMKDAHMLYRETPFIEPSVALDSITKDGIEKSFSNCERNLTLKSFTADHVHNCLVETEFSEWNDVFLLVINTFKKNNREFLPIVAAIQRHKNDIKCYFEALPGGQKFLDTIKHLSDILFNTILIVDDSPSILDFLEAIFSRKFSRIETATNGKEALEKINKTFFDVIISDVNMPLMNGVELIAEAQKRDPEIRNRFLFLAGGPSREALQYFDDNKLKLLIKPATINDIYQAVNEIMQRNKL